MAHSPRQTKFQAMTPEELRAAREEMGFTQDEAARLYELSLSGYKKYELGISAIPGPVKVLTKRLLQEYRKKL
jgi:transcriptional regulator with XRE-family HTH domain